MSSEANTSPEPDLSHDGQFSRREFMRLLAGAVVVGLFASCTNEVLIDPVGGKSQTPAPTSDSKKHEIPTDDLTPFHPDKSIDLTKEVEKLQGSLEKLEFWTGGVDGENGHQTKLAVAAFQKLYDREITGEMTTADLRILELQNASTVLDRVRAIYGEIHERTVIIDLERQLLTVVDPNKVIASLSTSTGNNELYRSSESREMVRAITPKGNFRVNLIRPGITHGPLGVYYDGVFFNGGIGFHGSNDVRINETASHGCARITNTAAHKLIDLIEIGVLVEVR